MKVCTVLLIVGALMIAGCAGDSGKTPQKRRLTERERDSTIAKSKLPGSRAVGGAMSAADSAAARSHRLDGVGE